LELKNELLVEIFNEWKEKSPSIAASFKERNRKQAKEPMVYFFRRFLQALFNGNEIMADEKDLFNWKEKIKELHHLPVNAAERLSFIEEQPDHYQSFIQLSELFLEWKKKSVIFSRRKT
jgi:hypothetical protein